MEIDIVDIMLTELLLTSSWLNANVSEEDLQSSLKDLVYIEVLD